MSGGDESPDETMEAITEAAESLGMKVAFSYQPTKADGEAAAARLAALDQAIDDLSGVVPRALVEFDPESRRNNNAWDDRANKLWLLTPVELEMIPAGTALVCISGCIVIKGIDEIDGDTRVGYLAYGLLNSQLPPVSTAPAVKR